MNGSTPSFRSVEAQSHPLMAPAGAWRPAGKLEISQSIRDKWSLHRNMAASIQYQVLSLQRDLPSYDIIPTSLCQQAQTLILVPLSPSMTDRASFWSITQNWVRKTKEHQRNPSESEEILPFNCLRSEQVALLRKYPAMSSLMSSSFQITSSR